MEKIALIALVVTAIFVIQTQKLRQAVMFMGVFSLASSFVYLLYNAVDVAIAEAVVGSTLSTILYLVALQKYKVFVVYYCHLDDLPATQSEDPFIQRLDIFCAKQELEQHVIHSKETFETISKHHHYAMVVECLGDALFIYSHPENYKIRAFKGFFAADEGLKDRIVYMDIHESLDGWEAQNADESL